MYEKKIWKKNPFLLLSFILVDVIKIWTVAFYYSQLWPVILISFMTPKGSWPSWSKPRLLCVTGYLFTCKLGTRPPGMKILSLRMCIRIVSPSIKKYWNLLVLIFLIPTLEIPFLVCLYEVQKSYCNHPCVGVCVRFCNG